MANICAILSLEYRWQSCAVFRRRYAILSLLMPVKAILLRGSTEAYIVHHADFMTFLPFKSRLEDLIKINLF